MLSLSKKYVSWGTLLLLLTSIRYAEAQGDVTSKVTLHRTKQLLESSSLFADDSVVVTIGNVNGMIWEYTRGIGASVETPYFSASAIKWVTSVVILRLVHEGVLSLADNPVHYLDYIVNNDATFQDMTVENLLSFTSGFAGKPLQVLCIQNGDTTTEQCAKDVIRGRFWLRYEPGTTYYYSPTHMLILAAMAQSATGLLWEEIFDKHVKQVLGMSPSTVFVSPSVTNPRISGGANITASDLGIFLRVMLQRDTTFLPVELWDQMLQDHTPDDAIVIEYTPIPEKLPFHYGLGVWRECTRPSFDETCQSLKIVSTTGATGVHGWVDYENGYYGAIVTDLGLRGGNQILEFAIESLRDAVLADLADTMSGGTETSPTPVDNDAGDNSSEGATSGESRGGRKAKAFVVCGCLFLTLSVLI